VKTSLTRRTVDYVLGKNIGARTIRYVIVGGLTALVKLGLLVRRAVEFVLGKNIGAETIRYVIVGGLTTLVNLGLFELLYSVIGIDVTVSNVTSVALAIVFAYVANKHFVFRRHSDSRQALVLEFFKFASTRTLTSMTLEVGGVLLFHNIMGFDARLCKISAQVLVIISNYIVAKLVVFRSTDGE